MADPRQRSSWWRKAVVSIPRLNVVGLVAIVVAGGLLAFHNLGHDDSPDQLLNVSYDPTRELYAQVDRDFVALYKRQSGVTVAVKQSHGGSGRQTADVIAGKQQADVVSLALPSDVEALRKRGLVSADWQKRLPNNSVPYTSTIVFVVHKDNPKNIHDWPDLVKDDIEIVNPDPRTSGNGKLSVLAAWGSVTTRGGTEAQASDFVRDLLAHVVAADPGARSAAVTYAVEKVGDVHLTWENEALREVAENQNELEIVYPPISIRAEPAVTWVDANLENTRIATYAKAYLEYLYTDAAQETAAEYGYRPIKPEILARHKDRLPPIDMFPVSAIANNWNDARDRFFGNNGIYDVVSAAPARQASAHPRRKTNTR